MSSYKKSLFDSAKYNQYDLPTATKTNYLESSPYLYTSSLKSPSSKIQSKIEEARENIDFMINQMSSKKNQNADAINRVRNINTEALGYARERQNYASYTPKKTQRQTFPRQQRAYRAAAPYENQGSSENYGNINYISNPNYESINQRQTYSTNNNLAQQNYRPYEHTPFIAPVIPQNRNLQQQNIELRRALNDQIRINNELVKRVNQLQSQNYNLKNHIAQNDAKGLRSTRLGSVSYGDDTNLNLSRRNVLPISGVPQTESYVQQSNGPLLNQRASYNLNYNPGNSRRNYQGYQAGHNYNEQSSLLHELDQLKRQNESLRQNTIQLLQSN